MEKVIEQTLYSLTAMAEDADERGQNDRARLLRACSGILSSEVKRLTDRVERLRGGLKWCSGRLLDANDVRGSEAALEMAGDMEPSEFSGTRRASAGMMGWASVPTRKESK